MSDVPIIDRNRIRSSMLLPSGSSPYFGWMLETGEMFTIGVDDVLCITPSGRSDLMAVHLRGGPQIAIPVEHGLRLMKRCGWTEEKLRDQLSR